MMRILIPLLFALFFLYIISGCSIGKDATTAIIKDPNLTDSRSVILGSFDVGWDGISENLTMVPNRELEAHHNVTPLLKRGYITLEILNWDSSTRVMTVKATIENPLNLDVYDVRGILPNLGTKKLLNPDDYTKLFDKNNPPVANPFRAFAKDEVNRKFWGRYANPDQYIKSEIYEIYFPDDFYYSYTVTASWPGNAEEPYDIVSINTSGTLFETSGSLEVESEILDWYNVTADHVIIEANPITTNDIYMDQIDPTLWHTTITNDGNAPPGLYKFWLAAYDSKVPYALYNCFEVRVFPDLAGWSDPILVAGEVGIDEILPRIVLRASDYWVCYSNGTGATSKYSTDGGYTWSVENPIGGYNAIDTMHAVEGLDNCIYVQYQNSYSKYINLSKRDAAGWLPPVSTSYHAMTLPPYSCDLGLGVDGFIYDMLGDDWSALGFRSTAPYDISTWVSDPISTFYHAIYSANDGFVQNVPTPKFFYVHEGTQLDYAWYDVGWHKDIARTGTDTLLEPAIAPESDGPFHGLITVYDGTDYRLEYFQYDTLPPTTSSFFDVAIGMNQSGFSSISVKNAIIAILFDYEGEIRYVESLDGGITFGPYDVLDGGGGSGGCGYSHVRTDKHSTKIVAAYAKQESGSYNIYVRFKV